MPVYPDASSERDEFVLSRRPPRPSHDPWRHQGVIVEAERTAAGTVERVATVFLTGRECPWKCVMCDLWKYTTVTGTPPGAIPKQILDALAEIRSSASIDEQPSTIKLYNAGSFFDPRAVPESDYGAIARSLCGTDRVIVECHPSLVGARVEAFMAALKDAADWSGSRVPRVEVALGLETVHPVALERLNKKFALATFVEAAARLRSRSVDIRIFLLVSPPFVPTHEQDAWLTRAIEFSLSCDATAISLIPTRGGNGAMEMIEAGGLFTSPTLADLERSLERALATAIAGNHHTRIFADLWNIDALPACPHCRQTRIDRIARMNLTQSIPPLHACARDDDHHD